MPTLLSFPGKSVWAIFGREALFVGAAFFSVYPVCNWYTSTLIRWYSPYVEAELAIPFLPGFIGFYLSMYVLFLLPPWFLDRTAMRCLRQALVWGTLVSGALFLLFPSRLGFPRVVPEDPFYGPLFASLFGIDLPHNLAPSLHVVYSALIAFAVIGAGDSARRTWIMGIWLLMICLSTLFVHQHHLLDVITGLGLALLIQKLAHGRNHHA